MAKEPMEDVRLYAELVSDSVDFSYEVIGFCGPRILFVHKVWWEDIEGGKRVKKSGPPDFFDIEDLKAWGWRVSDKTRTENDLEDADGI